MSLHSVRGMSVSNKRCLTCGKKLPEEYVRMYGMDECRECLQREIDST